MSKKCPNCWRKISNDSSFCSVCGYSFEPSKLLESDEYIEFFDKCSCGSQNPAFIDKCLSCNESVKRKHKQDLLKLYGYRKKDYDIPDNHAIFRGICIEEKKARWKVMLQYSSYECKLEISPVGIAVIRDDRICSECSFDELENKFKAHKANMLVEYMDGEAALVPGEYLEKNPEECELSMRFILPPYGKFTINNVSFNFLSLKDFYCACNLIDTIKKSKVSPEEVAYNNLQKQLETELSDKIASVVYDENVFKKNICEYSPIDSLGKTCCDNKAYISYDDHGLYFCNENIWYLENSFGWLSKENDEEDQENLRIIRKNISKLSIIEITRENIISYQEKGDLLLQNSVSSAGGGVNVSGAIIGGAIAGGAGMILGGREKLSIKSESKEIDNRYFELTYYDVAKRIKVMQLPYSLRLFLNDAIPEKEYSRIRVFNVEDKKSIKQRIEELNELFECKLISESEYNEKRHKILEEI